MTALAVMVALVGAMFVSLAPAAAHDLGECRANPEWLTEAKCEEKEGETFDHDNDADTDAVATWTPGTHTSGNHPPTLTITVLDSDGIVSDDSTVSVLISVANILGDAPTDDTVVEVSSFPAHSLDFVRVSGELEGPSTPAANDKNAANGFVFTQTSNGDDDNSAGAVVHTIIIPAGTSPGEYTVSTRLVPGTYYDYSGNDFVTKSARATFTVGDAGLGLSASELSLGNRVNDDPATLTDETKGETGTDSATGDGINLLVSAQNALGNKSNNSDVDQITVIAPGGEITIHSPMKDAPTARPQAKTPVITAGLATENNSSSISESGVTKAATDDAIRQTMSFNVNKANDQPGTVDVYVIMSGKGAAISNSITLTFTGPNDALALSDPSDTLLAFGEASELPEVLRRDIISFAVSATDEGGNPGGVPDVRTRILDVDGKVVNQEKISVKQGPNSNGVPNAKLTLTALTEELTPLKSGTYTIRINSTGGLVANGEFEVVGRANGVDLSVDTSTPSAVGEIVTATATVTAGGQPVPNGTVVTFAASDVTGDRDSVLVAVGGGAVQRAIGGVAEATFVAVGNGRSVISATAHRTTDVEVIASTAGATDDAMPEEEASVACLSNLNGFATWACGVESSASEIFGLVSGRGATALHLWNGSAWVRYSVVDGTMVPGSSDFMVAENDILYISN